MTMRNGTSTIAELLLWLGGPLIWAAHFAIMYGAETLFCLYNAGSGGASFQAFAMVFTAGAIAMVLAVMAWQLVRESRFSGGHGRREGASFLRKTSVILGLAALVAMLWAAVPPAMLSPCSTA
jgi:hypothetical protein